MHDSFMCMLLPLFKLSCIWHNSCSLAVFSCSLAMEGEGESEDDEDDDVLCVKAID